MSLQLYACMLSHVICVLRESKSKIKNFLYLAYYHALFTESFN